MNLYATDKEYKERFDYFLEEVKNDEGNKLEIGRASCRERV